MDDKSIYNDSPIKIQALLMLCAGVMAAISLYLIRHYFNTVFPSESFSSTVCNIDGFFNCDATTLSPMSNIFGVPIAMPGFMIGLLIFSGFMFKTPKMESSLFYLLMLNLAGCLILLFYSLFVLGSICPFCFIYYIASAGAFLLFLPYRKGHRPDILTLSILFVVIIIAMIPVKLTAIDKIKNKSNFATTLMDQFNTLPRISQLPESPFRLGTRVKKFDDVPIRIHIFSDFQCPACKRLNDVVHRLSMSYKDKLDMQYFFYPLDSNCNKAVGRPMHSLACKAAYMASCDMEKFQEIHDDIFENQHKLSDKWLENYAGKRGILDCMNSQDSKKKVEDIIAMAEPFNIRSTPTLFINGVKIEGGLGFGQMSILFDELIKKHNQE